MSKIKLIFKTIFSFRKSLVNLKLEALELNVINMAELKEQNLISSKKKELKTFLKSNPPDVATIVNFLDDFLDELLIATLKGRVDLLYKNRCNIAALSKEDHQDWVDFLITMDNQYATYANDLLKNEITLLQIEITEELTKDLKDPKNILFFTPGDGTVH